MSTNFPICWALLLCACSRSPSEGQLKSWLDETHREEQARRAKGGAAEATSWTLAVRGNVAKGAADYPWAKLAAMAKTHLKTTNPGHTADVKAVLDYRGVLISDLLAASSAREDPAGAGGKEITIIALDGFFHSLDLADIHRFPFLLAIEENGVPLVKKTGGPLLEIVPHTSHPETKAILPEGGSFYVTTVIVGTEAPALKIAGKVLGAKDLSAIALHTVSGKAGFRFRWPSGEVQIHGPLLRDVLAAAKVQVRPGERVLVRRKPRTDIPEREVTALRAEDVLACDIVVGLRHGEGRALIPAALGGPAVLAFAPSCAAASAGQAWPMFVEGVEVAPPDQAAKADKGGGR